MRNLTYDEHYDRFGYPPLRSDGKPMMLRLRESSGAADETTVCPNPYCHDGWVERGDNESGGAPAFACKVCNGAERRKGSS